MGQPTPLVAIMMGSKSDWDVMRAASETLTEFGIPHEYRVLSAHRTPKETAEFVASAEGRGFEVLIAAAGGNAAVAATLLHHACQPIGPRRRILPHPAAARRRAWHADISVAGAAAR